MQIFVPHPEPYLVAQCLDRRRLNKQIIECKQILAAIDGTSKAWANHPVVRMYRPYRDWLQYYMLCLMAYMEGDTQCFYQTNYEACCIRPPFLTEEFCAQHKRRLYTKDPDHYQQFAQYGKSGENWYFVDGKIVKYINGKRI